LCRRYTSFAAVLVLYKQPETGFSVELFVIAIDVQLYHVPLVIDVHPHMDRVATYPAIIIELLIAAAGVELHLLMVAAMGAADSLTLELHGFLLCPVALCPLDDRTSYHNTVQV
jgi:hypothetical protein